MREEKRTRIPRRDIAGARPRLRQDILRQMRQQTPQSIGRRLIDQIIRHPRDPHRVRIRFQRDHRRDGQGQDDLECRTS